MSIATIKRSHEIYSGTFTKDCKPNEVTDPGIEPYDRHDEIRDKQFNALQIEISAHENLIVGDKFNSDEATEENAIKYTCSLRKGNAILISESLNEKRLMKDEETIFSDNDLDQILDSDSEQK
jgi:hypothetical protein